MIILLNLISLNNNIAQFDDRAVQRPRGATTARHDRVGWTGKNLILDEALTSTTGNLLVHGRRSSPYNTCNPYMSTAKDQLQVSYIFVYLLDQ